jgi:SPP1 family predicted phage head-tail adaptor
MTGAGHLNRRLTLEAPTETDDGSGGVARDYTAAASLWAQLVPLSAGADAEADSLGGTLRYRIVVRAGPDITTRHRLRDGALIFRILAARPSADRRFIEIEAQARED